MTSLKAMPAPMCPPLAFLLSKINKHCTPLSYCLLEYYYIQPNKLLQHMVNKNYTTTMVKTFYIHVSVLWFQSSDIYVLEIGPHYLQIENFTQHLQTENLLVLFNIYLYEVHCLDVPSNCCYSVNNKSLLVQSFEESAHMSLLLLSLPSLPQS